MIMNLIIWYIRDFLFLIWFTSLSEHNHALNKPLMWLPSSHYHHHYPSCLFKISWVKNLLIYCTKKSIKHPHFRQSWLQLLMIVLLTRLYPGLITNTSNLFILGHSQLLQLWSHLYNSIFTLRMYQFNI